MSYLQRTFVVLLWFFIDGSHSLLNEKQSDFMAFDTETDVQNQVNGNIWRAVNLRAQAAKLGDHLHHLVNDELGFTAVQLEFDSVKYVSEISDLQVKATELAESVADKITSYRQVLGTNRALIENLYKFHLRSPITQPLLCCDQNATYFSDADGMLGLKTSNQYVCDLVPRNVSFDAFNPGRNLTKPFMRNNLQFPSLKSQFFVSVEGVHNEFPARSMPSGSFSCMQAHGYQHRDVFVKTMWPQPKTVVIVIDISMVLSTNQLETAKAIAKRALLSLSSQDMVTVLTMASEVQVPPSGCLKKGLAPASRATKRLLVDFIDGLVRSTSQANHTNTMEFIFSILPRGASSLILYVSRGLMNTLFEAKEVISVMAEGNMVHGGSVLINTYGLIEDIKMVLYEKAFLLDIARQNFTKYNVSYTGTPITPGDLFIATVPEDAEKVLSTFYAKLPIFSGDPEVVHFSEPYRDELSQDMFVTLSQPCFSDANSTGVVGLDVRLDDLTAPITYAGDKNLLAFLINSDGQVLVHPSSGLSLPNGYNGYPVYLAKLASYEALPGFEQAAAQILLSPNGTAELLDISESPVFRYSWSSVGSSPYKVVIRMSLIHGHDQIMDNVKSNDQPSGMIYHRLDLLPTDDMCIHFQQLATFQNSAIFLSAKAFEKPYEHLSHPETKQMIQNYLTYLEDRSSYISKPGLKDSVKNDALVTARVHSIWLPLWKTSPYSNFIVRRYIATPSGVFRMFPASLTRKDFEPSLSHWYKQAIRLPGKITLSRPYVDTAGAGFIVTVSRSVYEGRAASLHTSRDPIAAVVGADFPHTYFQRVLLDFIPVCEEKGIRCFIVDDRGYLITHPLLSLSAFKRSYEQQHITHMEPLLVDDILSHKDFVAKKLCNNFSDRTVQRYYHFNTSFTDTLFNRNQREQCLQYQLNLIPGTNVFVVMVNDTCQASMAAFCPCSVTDRLCLNCHRLEQDECECPCECPLSYNICTDELMPESSANPLCDSFTESSVLAKLSPSVTRQLPQCMDPKCDRYWSKQSCMGIVGCSWCEMSADGTRQLAVGYCDIQQACFGGVQGARTPYNDQLAVPAALVDQTDHLLRHTPVGPVTGAILGAILVLALSVYCYRNKARNCHRLSDSPDSLMPAHNGCFHHETDPCLYHQLPPIPGPPGLLVGQANLLAMEVPANISPYRVNVNYRRPSPVATTTDSSDHGYSTMTPHEEGEITSTSCIESLVSGYRPSLCTPKLTHPPKSRVRSKDGADCKKLLCTNTKLPSPPLDELHECGLLMVNSL